MFTKGTVPLQIIGVPCLLGFIGIAILSINIYIYSLRSETIPADAAIVLSAAVQNEQPSPVFRERINHAVNLYNSGAVEHLILTGGGEGNRMAESEVAKAYAVQQGVPPQQIFIEAESRTTFENLLYANEIVEEKGFTTVLIVSDPLHMKRAMAMTRALDMGAFPSPTPTSQYTSWRTKSRFLAREVYLYAGYLLTSW